jgi:DNA-binding MarR family transcriptional regulator
VTRFSLLCGSALPLLNLSPSQFRVLWYLDQARDKDVATVSLRVISKHCGLNVKTVQKALKALKKRDLIFYSPTERFTGAYALCGSLRLRLIDRR